MKILLFGKNGQVGWELQRSLAPLGELVAVDFDSTDLCGDFTNLVGIAETVRKVAPDVIVNAAAHTAVDKAESEPELARIVNALAPSVLATNARRSGALLVHYSTDYVFDGSGTEPWSETSPTGPLNVYGKTKLEGEDEILSSGCMHLIFRTSWVFSARGNNFAKNILKLASERECLTIVDDQFGTPTSANFLANITAKTLLPVLQHPDLGGQYHLVPDGETSWYGYATYLICKARSIGIEIKVALDAIHPVSANTFNKLAIRPRNSRLSTKKMNAAFGLILPHWRDGVNRVLYEINSRYYG